ncbi:sigma-70 family RNA polymerase sigma factor [Demequina sp. SYSU T00192]|uniref:Sigma-70 family RNA polymerase sigma factor n=1 Tax=Demequina litoralis TaxID=3051660 RepID=A0ABT8G891_9MICO|nr:sigma-70 family RNA polymerase sigma factor [Demequina sp. SYSU T00192]MDN4475376.1 sigma-70 family RNA polymerase sigma factor [Demequina sp. SYSU T00192]
MTRWTGLVEELMRERGPRLVAYAALLVGRDGDAEDLVHDALVKVFSRPRRLSTVGEAEAYVRSTMPSIVIDRARSAASRRRARDRAFERPREAPDLDAGLDVRRALRGLSPRVQVCVVLRFFDDLTVPQIAQRLGIAEGTVKRYLHDAVAQLAPLLDVTADWDEEPRTVEVVAALERGR